MHNYVYCRITDEAAARAFVKQAARRDAANAIDKFIFLSLAGLALKYMAKQADEIARLKKEAEKSRKGA